MSDKVQSLVARLEEIRAQLNGDGQLRSDDVDLRAEENDIEVKIHRIRQSESEAAAVTNDGADANATPDTVAASTTTNGA